ncbi:Protein of unknown function (DUF2790) [Pseudomonas sp. GM50]|nr:Protein of unknown function (DUF2790) [Pseudomonas sp. GM50]
MPGFFMSRVLKVRNMKLIKLIAFAGVMAMSMDVLAEGGGDRTFEKMLSANTQAMEQYAASQGKPAPVVKDYEYGMKLDVVKVVSVVRPQVACAVVPAAMTYEDSQGQLNTIKYTVAGDCRKRGG